MLLIASEFVEREKPFCILLCQSGGDYMKTDRLVSILVILLRKRKIRAKELAEMFEVSTRTILRDVEALNLAGIPIVTYQGANGGIGIAEGFRLDKSILTEDDMASIFTTLRGIGKTLPDCKHEILIGKFKNILSTAQLKTINSKANQIVIDPTPWGEGKALKDKNKIIRDAIKGNKEIKFDYINVYGNRTIRKVEPYSLILKNQKWYLYGYCHLRQEFRLFKLTRIDKLTVLDSTFNKKEIRPEEYPWEDEWQKPENMIALKLVFEKEMEGFIVDLTDVTITKRDDGKLLVDAYIPENPWIYSFILSFVDKVEVISPPHVRDELKQMANRIYNIYSN